MRRHSRCQQIERGGGDGAEECQGVRRAEHHVRFCLCTSGVDCYREADARPRVANAGIAQVKALMDLTEDDFHRMFSVNVYGVQNSFAAAAKQLIQQGNCKNDAPGKLIGVCRALR